MWRYIIVGLLLFCTACARKTGVPISENRQEAAYRFVSYNVENLFDVIDHPDKADNDFTPEGTYRWSNYKYYQKLKDIGKVLVNLSNDNKPPAIIGLQEIENRKVLEDLLRFSPLEKFQYAIVHEESPDERGIDVALLYDTHQFTYVSHEVIRITFPFDKNDKTRDVLIALGELHGEKMAFFVNHWPSRRGGAAETSVKREYVASQVMEKVKELEATHHIVLLGDFNDTFRDNSFQNVLQAKQFKAESADGLVDLLAHLESQGEGTYKFQNQWNLIDHFIVSPTLLDQEDKLLVLPESTSIFKAAWLLKEDPAYPGLMLNRTNRGPVYEGGVSDHLPIVLDLFLN